DVAIEITHPDGAMRLEFFRRGRLREAGDDVLATLVRKTDRLSFSHLREIEGLAGMIALRAGRPSRSAADLYEAADLVARASAAGETLHCGERAAGSLSVVRGGEGWGEGPSVKWRCIAQGTRLRLRAGQFKAGESRRVSALRRSAPHPCPLPRVRGRGSKR